MANYRSVARSNYFRVTDEKEFRKIIAEADAETEGGVYVGLHCADMKSQHPRYMVGCEVPIQYPVVDNEKKTYCLYEFVRKIAALLPDGEAFILVSTGNEKLNFVDAGAYVATNKSYSFIDLWDKAQKEASCQLGSDFQAEYTY